MGAIGLGELLLTALHGGALIVAVIMAVGLLVAAATDSLNHRHTDVPWWG